MSNTSVYSLGLKSLPMYPLKQGLKLHVFLLGHLILPVFTHVSIKTRIETSKLLYSSNSP